ncbi:MAG: SHOCT domain-containing protein [Clostridiales bacterium]|nr:SHOCT domain-containing protein [Clostridiales bacterium]
MSYYGYDNGDMAIAPKAGDGKLYKLIRLIAMAVIMIAAIFLILEIFQIFNLGTAANGIIFSLGVMGVGGMVALPWVRVFEAFKDKRYKIVAIVFLALVGVCVILWIVCVWQIIGLINDGLSGATDEMFVGILDSLNVIRISIIISLQFIIASYIAKNIIKYGKSLLGYQVIAGVSQLFFDFFICLVLTAITITSKGVEFSSTAILLTNKWTWALLAIAVVLAIFPNVVFRRTDRRNLLNARQAANDNAQNKNEENDADDDNAAVTPVDEKLAKIKDLLDKGLITQEEYDKKREDILNSI